MNFAVKKIALAMSNLLVITVLASAPHVSRAQGALPCQVSDAQKRLGEHGVSGFVRRTETSADTFIVRVAGRDNAPFTCGQLKLVVFVADKLRETGPEHYDVAEQLLRTAIERHNPAEEESRHELGLAFKAMGALHKRKLEYQPACRAFLNARRLFVQTRSSTELGQVQEQLMKLKGGCQERLPSDAAKRAQEGSSSGGATSADASS